MAEAILEDEGTGGVPEGGTPEGGAAPAPAAGTPPAGSEGASDGTPEGTIADGDGSEGDGVTPPSNWPEDWRERLAGDDKAAQNILKRFTSPEVMAKALVDLRKQISSGQYTKALAPDATEEEVAAWREANGIPESPDKYEIDLDGRVLPDDDDPVVKGFLDHAHKSNFPPQMVNAALQWYADLAENEAAETIQRDQEFKSEAIEELRSEWGVEYRANINSVKSFLGDEVGPLILGARGPDGNLLGNNPALLKFFAQHARELNPASTITGLGSPDLNGVASEIEKIEKEMSKGKGGEYWSGPQNERGETQMQVRYRQLLEAREKMQGQG